MRFSWEVSVRDLRALIKGRAEPGIRMRLLCDALHGSAYAEHPLIGGPGEPERFVVDLSAFDCVTFVETVLALARSRSRQGFIAELKNTRYRNAEVRWRSRLHYFSDWLAANEQRGALRVRTAGPGAREIQTLLGVIPALPLRQARLVVVPKKDIHLASSRLANGSIIAFASLRKRLDYFHAGLVFVHNATGLPEPEPLLYHASRSRGGVVGVPLRDFLRENRMRGVSFAEPLGTGGAS